MSLAGRTALLAVLLWLPPAGLNAVLDELTDRDIARALNLANASEAQRAVFHAPYLVAAGTPLVDALEVITPFRRFVLAAERALGDGEWMLARGGYDRQGRSLKDHLSSTAHQVSVRVRLRFHPHNSYVHLPAVDIFVGAPALLAIDVARTPHVTRLQGDGVPRDFIYGATVEAFFNAPSIANRTLPLRVVVDGADAATASIEFSRLD